MANIIADLDHAVLIEVDKGRYIIEKRDLFSELTNDVLALAGSNQKWKKIFDLAIELSDYLRFLHDIDNLYEIPKDLSGINEVYPIRIYLFAIPITNAEKHGNNYDLTKKTIIDFDLIEQNNSALLRLAVTDEGEVPWDYRLVKHWEKVTRGQIISFNTIRSQLNLPIPERSFGNGLFNCIRYCDNVYWNDQGNQITCEIQLEKKV